MLSINTNLSSLIAQNSLTTSTDKLNQAIERMTTGLKINHASDNAANYSISTNLTTQLSAYDIAADNVATGMDLVNYANDIISQMQDKAARLNALSTQARNGTYGAQSLSALNSEASAIMAEITRLYNTAEYNDISLFNKKEYTIASHLPQAEEGQFIEPTAISSGANISENSIPKAKQEYDGFIVNQKSYTADEIALMTPLTDSVTSVTNGEKYLISDKEQLENLSELVEAGIDTSGAIFVLNADIDLEGEVWTPIGIDNTKQFKGIFDGNGHIIKNLTINNTSTSYQGLFGYASTDSEIKNVAVENFIIKGKGFVGGLAGSANNITNCIAKNVSIEASENYAGGLVGWVAGSVTYSYTEANVTSTAGAVGGVVGYSDNSVENSYSTGYVKGLNDVGGLVGVAQNVTGSYSEVNVIGNNTVGGLAGTVSVSLTNSFAKGNVEATTWVGGLVGTASATVSNCYSTGDVKSTSHSVGGLIGRANSTVTKCYSTGNVDAGDDYAGGLLGIAAGDVSESYATGKVKGISDVGGLVGEANATITNSYATGVVTGQGQVGGLVGSAFTNSTIANSYATGAVTGQDRVGGLVGRANSNSTITNSYATGSVTGQGDVGGLVGYASTNSTITNSYATGAVTGQGDYVGGLVGYASKNSIITNSYATGAVTGQGHVGGLVGDSLSTITNSYATGAVTGQSDVGGLVGSLYAIDTTVTITDSVSYSKVTGADSASTGSLIGGAVMTIDGTSFGTLDITNCQARPIDGMNKIGGAYSMPAFTPIPITYDLTSALAGIGDVQLNKMSTTLQVGIYGNNSCQLDFDTNFTFNKEILANGIESVDAFDAIVEFEKLLSEKATMLGAVQNRLDSALESIEVNINNLTSSRSTIRDADIAEVSSEYIKQQILQQASATLMATANQSPAIALQLI